MIGTDCSLRGFRISWEVLVLAYINEFSPVWGLPPDVLPEDLFLCFLCCIHLIFILISKVLILLVGSVRFYCKGPKAITSKNKSNEKTKQ